MRRLYVLSGQNEAMAADWVDSARYISLVTFRKDGTGVATPVWFAVDGQGRLVVYSELHAGKMKRARNNPNVQVGPCTMKGAPTGGLVEATTVEIVGGERREIDTLLIKKYGWQKRSIDIASRLRTAVTRTSSPNGYLAITLA